MSIQIKHINGTVLYTAKDAKDVRAAVEDAVGSGAPLYGAYLREAYLGGANLYRANLRGADLRGAYLRGASLREADLSEAYLREAYLRGANLSGANLRGANLYRANLRGADLYRAKGIIPEHHNDLLILADQVGKVRAYKLVTADGQGPFNGGIAYEKGKAYEVDDADTNPENDCARGINLATLPWCIANWQPGHRILVAEFSARDIAAIPFGDGKFRVHRCKIVGEKNLEKLRPVES